MTPQEVLKHVQAKPFQPFRVEVVDGRSFDITHPKMIRVGLREVHIFAFVDESMDTYDRWDVIGYPYIKSLLLLESVERAN